MSGYFPGVIAVWNGKSGFWGNSNCFRKQLTMICSAFAGGLYALIVFSGRTDVAGLFAFMQQPRSIYPMIFVSEERLA